jgi:hypothetical protein
VVDHEAREVGLSVGAKALTTASVAARAIIERKDSIVVDVDVALLR